MVSRTDIEIKIERKLTPNVKENIFVTKPGTGRNHCLMGIHQVGKSTLVSDWGADWEETRKACIGEFLEEKENKPTLSFFRKEKIYELHEVPEMAKIFYFEDRIFHLGFEKIGKVLTDIQNGVLECQSGRKPCCYEKKKNDYLIRTKDGFSIKVTKAEQKKALEEIENVYTYFSLGESIFVKEHWEETTENIKKLFRAYTTLGFHFILIFDEFNNSETIKKLSRHRERQSRVEPESKDALLDLLRDLYPFKIEGGAVTGQRQYNLSVLVVSRQEMGMITGDEEDNILFTPWCLDGFSNSELEEYIEKLQRKIRNGISPYSVVKDRLGEKHLKRTMLYCCGRHPGLWGHMWDVLNMTYEAYLQDKNIEVALGTFFKNKSKEFFGNVILLMKSTMERIDNRNPISALKIFIHHFIDRHQYPIPNDKDNSNLLKYLELMEKQGFVSARNASNSFQVLLDKVEQGILLDEKYDCEISDEVRDLLGYEMHSPYLAEFIQSNVRECYGHDTIDVDNASKECELKVRDLLDRVYKIKYGEEKWLMKLKNRLPDAKKVFWYCEICKCTGDKQADFSEREAETLKKHLPWESLAYSDYGTLLKMHSYVFEKVLETWVEEQQFLENTFSKDILRMAEIRNIFAHRKEYDEESIEDDIRLCTKFLKGIFNGLETAVKRAGEKSIVEEENVIDLYDVDFVFGTRDKHKITGEINYNQKNYAAVIPKVNVSRKVTDKNNKNVEDSSDTYFEDLFSETNTIKVDVVKYCKEKNGNIYFVVQPMERSGLQEEWQSK